MIGYDFFARRQIADGRRRGVLAICGGGNAGHALAVVASQHFNGDIVWLTGSEEKAELLRSGIYSRDGLHATGVISGSASKVRIVSSNPAQIIPFADIVLIAVPAFAHAVILKQIAPFLKERVLVGTIPSRSGFEFEATQLLAGIEPAGSRVVFGLQTLPWSTRVQQPGKIVNFGAHKAKVLMATMPSYYACELAEELSRIFATELVSTDNFLNMTLGNPGQVIHPGLMYGHFAAWDGQQYPETRIPLFYAHATDETGAFMERVSAEIVGVASEIGRKSAGGLDLSGVLSLHDWLKVSYPSQTKDTSTAATCFRTGPLQARKAPMVEVAADAYVPNFSYRYLSEDVPFGLAITKAIAELTLMNTPALDTIIDWAQAKLDKRYMADGTMSGPDTRGLATPQSVGIGTLKDLIDWYARDRSLVASA